jgi:hypothetical protein
MALGKMTSLILPYANTEMMNLFLEHVAEDFKDCFVIMLIDQAGWHIAIAKSFVRFPIDFSRVEVENMICFCYGSVAEHAQPGECLPG